jgi:hypothetical protein
LNIKIAQKLYRGYGNKSQWMMQVKKLKVDSIWLIFHSLPGYLNIGQANSLAPSKVDHVFSFIIG